MKIIKTSLLIAIISFSSAKSVNMTPEHMAYKEQLESWIKLNIFVGHPRNNTKLAFKRIGLLLKSSKTNFLKFPEEVQKHIYVTVFKKALDTNNVNSAGAIISLSSIVKNHELLFAKYAKMALNKKHLIIANMVTTCLIEPLSLNTPLSKDKIQSFMLNSLTNNKADNAKVFLDVATQTADNFIEETNWACSQKECTPLVTYLFENKLNLLNKKRRIKHTRRLLCRAQEEFGLQHPTTQYLSAKKAELLNK